MSDVEEKKSRRRAVILIIIYITIAVISIWLYVHPIKCYFVAEWAIDDIKLRLAQMGGMLGGEALVENDEDLSETKDWLFWSCMEAFPDEIDAIEMNVYPEEENQEEEI